MKNILLITSLYPIFTNDNKTTFVCHYFARDWAKMGYNVHVIHIQPEYNEFVKKLVFIKGKLTKTKPLGGYIYENKLTRIENYVQDGVSIHRIPMHKFLPRNDFSNFEIRKLANNISKLLNSCNFIPEIITCHMLQWNIAPMINELNGYHAKLCMVSHACISQNTYNRNYNWISKYNYLGFRSSFMMKQFQAIDVSHANGFVCYSGIPAEYIKNTNDRHFVDQPIKFIYVGALIQRKYPEKILSALNIAFPNKDFIFNIVGKGEMHDRIVTLSNQLGISSNVHFLGQQPRDSIVQLYDTSDCMVMISRNEAYGLVYLEAMARGCITIASRNEGIDGVIIDGYNGYLCEAGNERELADIILKIYKSSPEKLIAISNNAIATAQKFTDILTAKQYIENIQ